MNANDLAKWMSQEHHKVDELMSKLRERVMYVPVSREVKWIEGVKEAFEHFRAHMTKHMALEEHDGYMSAVTERRPALSKEVDRLAHEHDEVIKIMNAIHLVLEDMQPDDRLLMRDCCHRVQDLLAYIAHHENSENLMVMTAFTDDLGTKD